MAFKKAKPVYPLFSTCVHSCKSGAKEWKQRANVQFISANAQHGVVIAKYSL